jgi:hypothetical protein
MEAELSSHKNKQSEHDARELQEIYAGLVQQLGIARGIMQFIVQKNKVSSSSQRVIATWSNELKAMSQQRLGSVASSAEIASIPSSGGASPMQPRCMGSVLSIG